MKTLSITQTSRKTLRELLPVIAEHARERKLTGGDALADLIRTHPDFERLERQARKAVKR